MEHTDFFWLRSYTKPASTRSSSETSSGSTTCATRFSVRRCMLLFRGGPSANHTHSCLQMRFRRFRRRRRHQLPRAHQIVHRRHDRASGLCARSLLPPPHRPQYVPSSFSFDGPLMGNNKTPLSSNPSQPSTQSAQPARPNTSVSPSAPLQHFAKQTQVRTTPHTTHSSHGTKP